MGECKLEICNWKWLARWRGNGDDNLLSGWHLHRFNDYGFDVEMIVAPEQTQRSWLEHIHFVRPVQFDFANIVAQIVWIRNDNLIFGAMFESRSTFGEIDATQCTTIRINRCRHIALHPAFCLSWLRQFNGESIVSFWKRDLSFVRYGVTWGAVKGFTYDKMEILFRWPNSICPVTVTLDRFVVVAADGDRTVWLRFQMNWTRRFSVGLHDSPWWHSCLCCTWNSGPA